MEATDRLFISIDTCSNIDEVKKQFPDLDFLTYFYSIIGYYRISTSRIVEHVFMSKDEYFDIVDGKIPLFLQRAVVGLTHFFIFFLLFLTRTYAQSFD